MLSHFDDREKFETMGKLCSEVLGLVGEDILDVNDETTPMIADTLKAGICLLQYVYSSITLKGIQ